MLPGGPLPGTTDVAAEIASEFALLAAVVGVPT